MDSRSELYDDGEFVMAEFELDDDLIVDSNGMQSGSTLLVSNESNGLLGHEDLAKFFELQGGFQIPAEEVVERTLTDPALMGILHDANGQIDFDPEAEQLKLREFLSGVNNCMELNALPGVVVEENKSPALRFILCSNCSGIFDTPAFQNHICEYDANQKQIVAQQLPPQPEKATLSPRITSSERIIVENQVRMRRYIKDELKYDLETGYDSSKMKESTVKGTNECSICERKFVHSSGLARHLEKHALDQIPAQATQQQHHATRLGVLVVLKCNHCGRIFFNVKLALKHIHVHRSSSDVVQSTNVDKVKLKHHLELLLMEVKQLQLITKLAKIPLDRQEEMFNNHVVANVLQCEFCDYIFADVAALLRHSATHKPEQRFECTACDLRLTTAKEASVHYQTDCVYMREELKELQVALNRLFVCNVCKLKYANVELLQEHRCLHFFPRLSETGTRLMLPCEFCATNFQCATEIQAHYEEKHLNRKKREKEQLRNISSAASSKVRLRQYLCDICGKSYTQSSHLWQHLRFHQGVKPFVCPEANCGRKFTIRPDLNDHIRKCHTGERPYHCLVCGKRFLTGSVFYQHRLIHRGERRYECEECGKRFYRADALKNHQRIHTGEKPYDCPFCTKTFRQRGDRDKHVRARHSHLDENARLMMRMQKFELEKAAALKAKQLHEVGIEYLVESGDATSIHSVASPSSLEPNIDYSEYPEETEFVSMPIKNEETDIMSYMEFEGVESIEPPPFKLENNGNVKVVVVENNSLQPFYF
ncbi:testis-specific zinc finger protein topi isoform X2 [Drosophila grimshawi]|uniref:testis-specific zinc finger protein topi isoform X2 n=1 Tax=Drosophila grimshawi TaxID=7222 RepID=UPI000C86FA90|nr:testis-specific zinc finger protein topi isoform X2 [Drosophila grimshawi]